ncbi:MAG TPA: CHAD domain-containing protein [Steroidobacteraceae bacterium]|nr:CHAD domain-containing protein [Steroidobacteraceae bacterium]
MASNSIDARSSGTRALKHVVRHFARRAGRAFASAATSATAVHEARKDLKRCRTALRLLRPALTGLRFHRANAVLRDAAHSLNAARDAKVLTQTLQSLREESLALRRDPAVAELARVLQAEEAAVRWRLRARPAPLARTRRALDRLCGRMGQWRVGVHGWSVLGPALQRIYRGGRRALPAVQADPVDRTLHEWRKQVKYLRYALEILTPMRRSRMARLARQAKQLTDYLGEVHDLAVLARRARGVAKRNGADLQPLLTRIDRRRGRLTHEALALGGPLYCARPRDWERPLERYWRRWRRVS